jgi:GNAT superfamily N-acetyltransferase
MGENIKLRDGSEVILRPLIPDDREGIRSAFDRLSPESRYRRFFVSLRELSDGLLDVLTDVDHDNHEALVGLDPQSEEIVGVARYVRMPERPERAEASVAVVDDWQGRGLGRELLERLVTRAREMGISRFVAFTQADNRRAVEVMSHLGPTTSSLRGDLVELDIELPAHGIGAPLASALRAAAGALLDIQPLAERIWRRAREMPGAARLPGGRSGRQ